MCCAIVILLDFVWWSLYCCTVWMAALQLLQYGALYVHCNILWYGVGHVQSYICNNMDVINETKHIWSPANYVIIDRILSLSSDALAFWVINILGDSWVPLLLGCLEGHYGYDNTGTVIMYRLKMLPEFHVWQVWCTFASPFVKFETIQNPVSLITCFMPFGDKVARAWSWALISNSMVDSWNFISPFLTCCHASCSAQGQLYPYADSTAL